MTRWPGAAPTRRRFVAIAAAAAGLPFAALRAGAEAAHLRRWSGVALGAAAEIVLYHPDATRARRLIARCVEEIDRLEDVFSLYRPESAIRRLNRTAISRRRPWSWWRYWPRPGPIRSGWRVSST